MNKKTLALTISSVLAASPMLANAQLSAKQYTKITHKKEHLLETLNCSSTVKLDSLTQKVLESNIVLRHSGTSGAGNCLANGSIIQVHTTWNPNAIDPLFTETLPNISAMGYVPLISWEPYDLELPEGTHSIQEAIKSSQYNDYIKSWVKALKFYLAGADGKKNTSDDRRVYLRFAPDANSASVPWSSSIHKLDPAIYTSIWKKTHRYFESQGLNDHVTWVWEVSAWNASSYNIKDFFPGNRYVDMIGLGGEKFAHNDENTWDTIHQHYDNLIDKIQANTNKPLYLSESIYPTEDLSQEDKLSYLKKLKSYLQKHSTQIISPLYIDSNHNILSYVTGAIARENDSTSAAAPKLKAKRKLAARNPAPARQRFEFNSSNDLSYFERFSMPDSTVNNGELVIEDNTTGDYVNKGILSTDAYLGNLDIILGYKDHALVSTGYQGVLKLILSTPSHVWGSKVNAVMASNKLYQTINYSWMYQTNQTNTNWVTTKTPRIQDGFLRLVRKDGQINAYFRDGGQWKTIPSNHTELIDETGPLRVGIQMHANYNDVYSAKADFLQVISDQDQDGLSDYEEIALSLNPALADTDADGVPDKTDLHPSDASQTIISSETINNEVSIYTYIDTEGVRWYWLENTSHLPKTATITDATLAAGTEVKSADETESLLSYQGGISIPQIPPFGRKIMYVAVSNPNDDDSDGISNDIDNCPLHANADQLDTDNDQHGNVCDTDDDGDDMADNWELQYGLNPLDSSDASGDLDGDGLSNYGEFMASTDPLDPTSNTDTDQDGILNHLDNCPTNANSNQINFDGDSQGDACDSDDDNDGLTDTWEIQHQLNPLDASDYNTDLDNDGFINADEFKANTDPNDAQSKPGTIYPSTATSWVIPGNFETPTDATTLSVLQDAEAVKTWELNHADAAFGGTYGSRNNEIGSMVGYMYNQKLEFNPTDIELSLKDRAESEGKNYEDFFLHFSEDTALEDTHPTHGSKTPLNGRFTIVGFTQNDSHAGSTVTVPYNNGLGVWNYASTGGLHTFLFEKFDQIDMELVNLSSDGALIVEYPSAVDSNGVVTQWSPLTTTDNTNDLQQNGTIRWTPPTDWQRAATYNAAASNGAHFGQSTLQQGARYYVIRLRLENNTGTKPTLKNVSLKKWITPSATNSAHKVIPGWDASNDTDSNGYIDDAEFAARANTAANARFRYEARVVPVGNMWGDYSSFGRTDLANVTLKQYLGDFYKQNWSTGNYSGAYNDSFFRMLGDNTIKLVSGGNLEESGLNIGSTQAQTDYETSFADTLNTIRSITSSHWVSANISGVNLYTKTSYLSFVDALDAVLREDYLKTSVGLSGFFGLNKSWDTFALANDGKKSILMAMNKAGRSSKLANTQQNWEKDIESGLAQYYLLNVPGKTYYQAWNSTYWYGSGNTAVASNNFWKAGIPKNYAYQPEKMLQVDIGTPDGVIPTGKTPLQYMTKTQTPLSDYTIIGDSTDNQLTHSEIGQNGSVDVVPSNIFYLDKSSNNVVNGGPAESVLARSYTNGLTLFRTDFFGNNLTFMQSMSAPITLPGNYQRVNFDGTLGPVINTITLAGYEGAVLVKAP